MPLRVCPSLSNPAARALASILVTGWARPASVARKKSITSGSARRRFIQDIIWPESHRCERWSRSRRRRRRSGWPVSLPSQTRDKMGAFAGAAGALITRRGDPRVQDHCARAAFMEMTHYRQRLRQQASAIACPVSPVAALRPCVPSRPLVPIFSDRNLGDA